MARLSILFALCLAAALTAHAATDLDPEVCSGPADTPLVVGSGRKSGHAFARKAARQLTAAVADVVHLREGCKAIKSRAKVLKACTTPVKKGEVLPRDDIKAAATGTLYDMILTLPISCKDGSYKVRYEARGIKRENSNKLKGVQTSFRAVFDSTYA